MAWPKRRTARLATAARMQGATGRSHCTAMMMAAHVRCTTAPLARMAMAVVAHVRRATAQLTTVTGRAQLAAVRLHRMTREMAALAAAATTAVYSVAPPLSVAAGCSCVVTVPLAQTTRVCFRVASWLLMAARKSGTASVACLTTLALKAAVARLLAAKLDVAAGSSHAATLPPVTALAARLRMAVAAHTQRMMAELRRMTVAACTQRTMARLAGCVA